MNSQLLIAILAGLGGMLGWGFADFCAKKTVDSVGAIKSLVWAHVFGTSFFLIITLATALLSSKTLHFPTTATNWFAVIFFGVLQMIVYWLAYEAFGKGQLAVLNPIFAAYTGLVALGSVIFYGEKLTPHLAFSLAIIFAGIILLNVDTDSLKNRKLNVVPGLKEIIAATILATIWTLGWDRLISGKDVVPYTLVMYASMTVAAFIIAKLTKTILKDVPRELWKFIILIGAGETLAYLAISWGYAKTPLTSVVALVSGAFAVPTVLLAYFFLKERITRLQVVAIGLTIIGTLLISLE
jgi:transporter family protein